MRKVSEKDEVPIWWFSQEEIKKRQNKLSSIQPSVSKHISKSFTNFTRIEKFDVVRDIDTLYGAVDKYYKKQVAPNSVCRPSCAYCCHVPVDLTLLEATRIFLYLGEEFPLELTEIGPEDTSTACPFLGTDAKCSIYRVRPFNCRLFASIDSWYPCRDNEPHIIHCNGSSDTFIKIVDHLKEISSYIPDVKLPLTADIRQYFGHRKK
ncbi:YkgJ family cysteine cluster protein [Photobacterium leiognathi]|uniref:YkgJ family cysteine cluster protein n=1 Tax=Photobacterium leiognathi TaxID=553611 RepID=UPI0029811FF2|nr:YkgJ family cysteine cluster protein [Photobacterium leiognathi]